MQPRYLPATASDDATGWQQTVRLFLGEKERRSGSRRTVEDYVPWPGCPPMGFEASPKRLTSSHGKECCIDRRIQCKTLQVSRVRPCLL
jgi:hypothetical protein